MYPNPSNVRAPDSWFYGAYMDRMARSSARMMSHYVLNAYLNVYVQAGDVEGAKMIKEWAIRKYDYAFGSRVWRTYNRLSDLHNNHSGCSHRNITSNLTDPLSWYIVCAETELKRITMSSQ